VNAVHFEPNEGWLTELKEAFAKDPLYKRLLAPASSVSNRRHRSAAQPALPSLDFDYDIEDGLIYALFNGRKKLFVSFRPLQAKVMAANHDHVTTSHVRMDKTVELVSRHSLIFNLEICIFNPLQVTP